MNKCWIIGAGGFGLGILNIILMTDRYRSREFDLGGIIDDRLEKLQYVKKKLSKDMKCNPKILDLDYLTCDSLASDNKSISDGYVFGFLDPIYKRKLVDRYSLTADSFYKFTPQTKVYPGCNIGKSFIIDARISTNVSIGNYTYIDAQTVIGHDVSIGDFCHIGVGVTIGGNCTLEAGVTVHSGAIIGANVTIHRDSIIGAGAVILRDVSAKSKIIAPAAIKI